jgi:hypothetical protein
MKDSIDNIIHRTQRYWYVDGLAEITVGLFFVVLSGYFLAQARIKSVSSDPILADFGLLAAILLVLWFFLYAFRAVKARLTYSRTGYVASPRRQVGLRWQRVGLAAWMLTVGLSLTFLAYHSHGAPSWMPLLLGVVVGLTLLYLSFRFQLRRFTFLACALVLVGAIVAFLNLGGTRAEILSSAADGLCFIISGGVALVGYLRRSRQLPDLD